MEGKTVEIERRDGSVSEKRLYEVVTQKFGATFYRVARY